VLSCEILIRLSTLTGHVIGYASSEKISSVYVGCGSDAISDGISADHESNRRASVWRSGRLALRRLSATGTELE
jgi:hypothetical protein